MPSKRTTNYELSQWEPDDKVLRADFNADNLAIDAAIKAVDVRVDGKVDASTVSAIQSTLSSLQNTVKGKQDTSSALKLTAGAYSGNVSVATPNTSGSQTISLGFRPKAVPVIPEGGNLYGSDGSGHVYGGLAVTNHSGTYYDHTTLEITSSGFQVYTYRGSGLYYSIELNNEGRTYHYIALG